MNQEKQRKALEKILKKCPDVLTPMKASHWAPIGKNAIYAAIKSGEIESFIYRGGYIFTKDRNSRTYFIHSEATIFYSNI